MESGCIFSTNDEIQAKQVINILESNSIPTMIKNLHIQNIFGGLKPFSGSDFIAGAIEIYITEENLDKAMKLLKEFLGEDIDDSEINTVDDKDENNIELPNENNIDVDSSSEKSLNIKAIFYFSMLLSGLSFLIIPYFINIFYLVELYRKRRTIFWMLLVFSSFMVILGILFILPTII